VSAKKPYRLLAFLDGRMTEEGEYDNWAQIGGKIGNLAEDADTIQVRYLNNLVLLYRSEGIY